MSMPQGHQSRNIGARLRVLTRSFGQNLDRIHALGTKIKSLKTAKLLSPKLLGKMTAWVTHLSKLQNRESQILEDICKIEQKHQALRVKKILPRACASVQREEPKPHRRKSAAWYLLVLALFFDEIPKKKDTPAKPQNG